MIRGFFSFPLVGRFRVGLSVPLLSTGSRRRRVLNQLEQTKNEVLARAKSRGISRRDYKLLEYSFRKNIPLPTRDCPFCRSTIDFDCLVCPRCRRDIATEEETNNVWQSYIEQLGRQMDSENLRRWIISGVVIAGIVLALSINKEKQVASPKPQVQSNTVEQAPIPKPQVQTTDKPPYVAPAPYTPPGPVTDTSTPATTPGSGKSQAGKSQADKSRAKTVKQPTNPDRIKGLY
jgi:hypothetical protein